MSDTLLETKLFIPVARANSVSRSRLLEHLNTGISEKLTLISAPAGFGKSSLAREWVLALDKPIAWLSLDANDNDLTRFIAYLIAALQQINPSIGQSIQAILGSPDPPPTQTFVAALTNDIAATPTPFVLVLDDYHTIREVSIHETVRGLLDRQPPQMHLVIATREDPPLPLARLRAQGQMIEIRARHLRFTQEETATFLNGLMGLSLSEKEVATLTARTEGWIAGLQLAALSLRDQTDRPSFVRAFTGTDRHVVDYLVDEVLSQQGPEIQKFLLQTSILDRLSGPLCEAVTGAEGGDSQSILEYLEQANLFLVPLDNQRAWYRYHHLFAELLRARLRSVSADLMMTLHMRAANWYEQHGLTAEAINHALAARNWELAATWVEQNARDLLAHGQMAGVMSWIAALPKETASRRPRLCVELAWALAYANRLQEVEFWLRNAEVALEADRENQNGRPPALGDAEQRLLRANVVLLRAYLALLFADPAQALALGRLAGELLPQGDPLSCTCNREFANLHWLFGYVYRLLGDPDRATDSLTEAVRRGKAAADHWHTMLAMTELGMIYRHQGRIGEAADTFREIFEYADSHGIRSHGYLGRVEANLSLTLLDQNKLDEGLDHARQAVELTQNWQSSNHMAWAHVVLARVLMACGDVQEADHAIQAANRARKGSHVLPGIDSFVEAGQVRLWLLQDNLAAAKKWAHDLRTTLGSAIDAGPLTDENLEMKLITLARILIAEGRETSKPAVLADALKLLERLKEAAVQGRRARSLIEIGVLQSIALFARNKLQGRRLSQSGEVPAALAVLENTLRLAEPEGYVRLFVDEGRPMAEMLYEAAAQAIAPSYCGRLLAAFAESESEPQSAKAPPAQELIEPLSQRELDVLRLMAGGLSNSDIAERLTISLNTVKGHSRNIYGKLNVSSRTQAIARARALGLLPSK